MEESSPVGYQVSISNTFGKHHRTLLKFMETLPPDTKTGVCILYLWRWENTPSCCPEGKAGQQGIAVVDEF